MDRLKLEAGKAVSEDVEAAPQEEGEREAAQPEAVQLAEVGGRQVGGECVEGAPQGQGLQAGESLWIKNQDLVNSIPESLKEFESIATLPSFGPIEGKKWFDQISSQSLRRTGLHSSVSEKSSFYLLAFESFRSCRTASGEWCNGGGTT